LKRNLAVVCALVILAFLCGASLALRTPDGKGIGSLIITTSVWGMDSEWLWTMMQFIAIVFGFIFIYEQIRLQAQANMLVALQAMSEKWVSEFMLQSRAHACAEYKRQKLEIGSAVGTVIGFFEDLGMYRTKGIFDLGIVWEQYSYFVEHYWSMYREAIVKFRQDTEDNSWYSHFETLFKEFQDYSAKKNAPTGIKNKAQIDAFITFEQEATETAIEQHLTASGFGL